MRSLETLTAEHLTIGFTSDGAPTHVLDTLDLQRVDDVAAAARLCARRADRVGLIGVAAGALLPEWEPLLRELTLTLVPHDYRVPQELARYTVAVEDPAATARDLAARAERHPRATFATLGLLGMSASLAEGVVAESFAYSMLLAGPEFAAWRASRTPKPTQVPPEPVLLAREGDTLHITLNVPDRRNAFDRHLRAGLVDALELARLDPSIASVRLDGAGPTFSSGGDLDEFGHASDLAAAHAIRLHQSAGLAISAIADKVTVTLHGRCFGAGIEVPAFARTVRALPGTTVCLPELAMGLMPGAGGTASIKARVGAWRTAYMALSGAEIEAEQALEWGLIDQVVTR